MEGCWAGNIVNQVVRLVAAPGFRETTLDSSVTVSGRSLKFEVHIRASAVCRKQKLTLLFSVSPLEKADAQIQVTSVGYVPVTDTRSIKMGVNLRPTADPRT